MLVPTGYNEPEVVTCLKGNPKAYAATVFRPLEDGPYTETLVVCKDNGVPRHCNGICLIDNQSCLHKFPTGV